jgi:hypothetical protein
MYTSVCIARVFDDHRSCQKLINYITNIKAKSKRYHWIQKIPVLKRLFIQNFCKRSRCLEENPVFLFISTKKIIMKKEEFYPSLQVVFWHCCLLLFGVTNNRVSNDAFRTFIFSMQQCIVYMTKKLRIHLLILDFKLGTIDNRKDYLQTWGEFFFFH